MSPKYRYTVHHVVTRMPVVVLKVRAGSSITLSPGRFDRIQLAQACLEDTRTAPASLYLGDTLLCTLSAHAPQARLGVVVRCSGALFARSASGIACIHVVGDCLGALTEEAPVEMDGMGPSAVSPAAGRKRTASDATTPATAADIAPAVSPAAGRKRTGGLSPVRRHPPNAAPATAPKPRVPRLTFNTEVSSSVRL